MKKNNFEKMSFLVVGLIIGILLTSIVGWVMMPNLMLNVHKSKLGFDETITFINQSVSSSNGWAIPVIHNLQGSLIKAGYGDMTRIKVIELCNPNYAYDVLKDDQNKKISAIMPCRIGVYEDKSGQVYIAEMNTKLISKIFGGNVAKVMGVVSEEEETMLKEILG
jgi:uncharacterized protein (DUF302 family)